MLSDSDLMLLKEENARLKKQLVRQQEIIAAHQATISQKEDIISQKEDVISQKEDIISQKEGVITQKEALIEEKMNLIARLQRMLFGQRRERFEDPNQLSVFQEIPVEKIEEIQQEAAQSITITYTKEKKVHPGRAKLPGNLEVVETVLEPVGDLSQMTLVGQEVTEELGYQPEKFFLHRIIRKKYAPKSSEGSFAIAALPDRVIPKGIPSVELLVQILVDKYIDHLPLYRIQQRFTRNGIKIPNATIDNWVKTCIDRLLILYEYSQKLTKAQDYLQVDETTVKVQDKNLKGKTHLGYYWVYHAPVNGLLFFEYHASRAGKYINQSLKNFKGYLQTDGYAGYNALAKSKDIVHVSCMAHIRRKYDEALSNDNARAQKALTYIQALYHLERKAKEDLLEPEKIKAMRLDNALPIINEMGKWIAEQNPKVLPQSAIGKAFRYTIERWDEMSNYLYNGNLQIDNNLIENAIRPLALGRKNWLFAGSHEAAQRSAIIYTFFAQCKKANVNPSLWLARTLQNILETNINQLELLLPHNFIHKS